MDEQRTLADTWGYLYDSATGLLVSEATVIVDPLPPSLTLKERPTRADFKTEQWDAATLTHIARKLATEAPLP